MSRSSILAFLARAFEFESATPRNGSLCISVSPVLCGDESGLFTTEAQRCTEKKGIR